AWHAEKDHGRHGDIPGVGDAEPDGADAERLERRLDAPPRDELGCPGWVHAHLSLCPPHALATTSKGLEERLLRAEAAGEVPLGVARLFTVLDLAGGEDSALGAGREVEEVPNLGDRLDVDPVTDHHGWVPPSARGRGRPLGREHPHQLVELPDRLDPKS